MKRLYGGLKMRWLTVVLFAVIAGAYTAAVMLIPRLSGTSFQDIAITFEWWVIFAVIIVVNCEKSWEAMLKCFVFFVISQPVVYTVEVLAGSINMDQALMYLHLWLPRILLTLPGGFIAYFCKKQNVFGSIVLGLGNTIQAVMGVYYLGMVIRNFPYHLLSTIVCFGSIIVMSFCIQKQKKYRLVSLLVPVICTVLIGIAAKMFGLTVF